MGAARRRGTYEQRKAAAIERDRLEQEERDRQRFIMVSRMTPDERDAYKRKKQKDYEFRCYMGALIAGLPGNMLPYRLAHK